MDPCKIEGILFGLIEASRVSGIPESDLDEMASLVRAGESGVALENLCCQLHEYDVAVSVGTVESVKELGKVLGIDEKYWRRLAAEPSNDVAVSPNAKGHK